MVVQRIFEMLGLQNSQMLCFLGIGILIFLFFIGSVFRSDDSSTNYEFNDNLQLDNIEVYFNGNAITVIDTVTGRQWVTREDKYGNAYRQQYDKHGKAVTGRIYNASNTVRSPMASQAESIRAEIKNGRP